MGGGHTKVGRPAHMEKPARPRAPYAWPPLKQLPKRHLSTGDATRMWKTGYQTRSLLFCSDRPTIKPGTKTHKPADSGVAVGNDASRRSLREVTLTAVKHASIVSCKYKKTVGASLLAKAVGQPTSMLTVPPYSRAGSLPQGDGVSIRLLWSADRACHRTAPASETPAAGRRSGAATAGRSQPETAGAPLH
jgi:hypothetical protein